jgi:hypothetical protein
MRFTTIFALISVVTISVVTTACVGEISTGRKPGRDSGDSATTGPCTKIEKDVTIRAMADMSTLPRSGCYDIYGKLSLEGSQITTLLALEQINSVDELDLNGTGLTKIDTKRPLGIYGKLTVTGNAKLTNLRNLSFETAADGILIDGNPALTSLDPLTLDDPMLQAVNGDLTITNNPALTAIPLKNLTKVTGATMISDNMMISNIDLSKLSSPGHLEIANNPRLSSLSGFTASTINGDFAIRNNAALTSLGTMSSLYRVAGNVVVENNTALTNLAAFTSSVKLVDKALQIVSNPVLGDLGALKHLQLVQQITITNNRNLVTCRAIEVDRCTQHPVGSVINNNGTTNCNWQCN